MNRLCSRSRLTNPPAPPPPELNVVFGGDYVVFNEMQVVVRG